MTASMATQGMNVAPLEQLGSEGGQDISPHSDCESVITVLVLSIKRHLIKTDARVVSSNNHHHGQTDQRDSAPI